ncbi:MAG TPA: hypothetical protein VGH20_10645 [Myxococcales bacterium]|jgi:hypothetical protein
MAASGCSWSLNQDDPGLRLYLKGATPQFPDQSKIQLEFDWWDPLALTTSYTLERAAPGEPFHQIGTLQQVGAGAKQSIVLGPNDPAGHYQFRLFALVAGQPSNVVTYDRAMLAPTLSVTQSPTGFSLAYGLPPLHLDSVTISRAVLAPDGSTGPSSAVFTTTTPAAGGATFVDLDLSSFVDGNAYVYTVAIASGGQTASAGTQTGVAKPAPPEVTAQANGAAVHLQFRSTSRIPGTLHVLRDSGTSINNRDPVAIVQTTGADQVFTADDTLPQAGLYEYHCTFTTTGFQTPSIASARAVLAPPGWKGTLITVPLFVEATRSSSGQLALLADVNGVRMIIPPGGAAGDGFAVPSDYHPPRLLLDAADHPHAAYAQGASVVHVFYDGAQWQQETIAPSSAATAVDLTVGADGALWAAWADASGLITVASSTAAGTWSTETLPATFRATQSLVVAADENSVPHLASADPNPFHLFKDASGWVREDLPPSSFLLLTAHVPSYLSATAQKVTMVDRESESPTRAGPDGFVDGGIAVSSRTSGTWTRTEEFGAPIHLPSDPAFVRAAISKDQSRVIVTSLGDELFSTGEPGLIFTEPFVFPTGLGFKPDGGAWMLSLFDDFTSFTRPATLNAILFEETP